METPIKMDDLGGKPTIFGNIHVVQMECGFLLSCFFSFSWTVPKVCKLIIPPKFDVLLNLWGRGGF